MNNKVFRLEYNNLTKQVKIATELTGHESKQTERSLSIGNTRQTECA